MIQEMRPPPIGALRIRGILPMPQPTSRSAADDVFFTALENGHPVRAACKMARYARRCVYRWRAQDTAFAARWVAAMQVAGDLLEEEADRRGRDGFDVPVFYQGKASGTKREYSNGLLLARLKAIRPEMYRERGSAATPRQPQLQLVSVVVRDYTLEALARRLLRGETVDPACLPQHLQALAQMPDTDAGQ